MFCIMSETRDLHRHLAAWRLRKGLSQEQIGNRLGVDKSTIHRWETGKRAVDLSDLVRLAAIYQVDPVALLLSPDDALLAARLTRAKAILEAVPEDVGDRWLETGADIAGDRLPKTQLPS
jgi:transcriptional regulator with XRE-family HTH domain